MSADRPLNKASIHDYPLLPGFPLPSDRASLQHEVTQLEKEHHERYLTDPVFHARSRMIGNFLDQLESIHEAGDTERTGFLIAALLDRDGGNVAAEAWEKGMADAKLQALGIKPHVRNPYLEERA
jgi:hypothetical protein